jgi:hypothetical protein
MIENEVQLKQARKALALFEDAVADLKKRIGKTNPELFEALAAAPLEDIERIRQEIDVYTGLTQVQKKKAPLWLKLQGENIKYGKASAKILSDWLKNVVDALRNVITFLYTGKSAGKGAPPKEISALSEIDVAAFAPGSLEIGFRLPEETQLKLFEQRNFPEEALFGLLKAVTWLDSENPEDSLEEDFPDPAERKVVLNEAMNLIPSEDSPVSSIEFSGTYLPREGKVRLNPRHKERGEAVIDKLKAVREEEEEKVEAFIGWIAEVDYAEYPFTFELHDPDDPRKRKIETCYFTIDLVKEVHENLDYNKENPRRVKVKGRRKKKKIEAISIEPIEESK